MKRSNVRLVKHMSCLMLMIFWVINISAFADARKATLLHPYSSKVDAKAAEPPFSSRLMPMSSNGESLICSDDDTLEDYGGWGPSPYFGGGDPGPIPHPA
ncbi:OLC1v1018131C1 [Oldenlandia corymbosa var. corymbosa]|uniref:OLC1v1018131C1 n=1 Tax=Oldenlandia corymbosa var. corymbosa TaxID=529605 RepID=A0AAV1EB48_OLDCO|nr:OLC1v1018131C1 [Oldenlandia corymbosa var. corymbosa]